MRNAIKSVVHNFLGTFSSRNSDFNGYWMFGFLIDRFDSTLEVPLVGSLPQFEEPFVASTAEYAATRFREQVEKSGIDGRKVSNARLKLQKLPEVYTCRINEHECPCCKVLLEVEVTANTGRKYRANAAIYVAPHNSQIEKRSTRC